MHTTLACNWDSVYSDRACWVQPEVSCYHRKDHDSQIRFNFRSLSVAIYISIAGERDACNIVGKARWAHLSIIKSRHQPITYFGLDDWIVPRDPNGKMSRWRTDTWHQGWYHINDVSTSLKKHPANDTSTLTLVIGSIYSNDCDSPSNSTEILSDFKSAVDEADKVATDNVVISRILPRLRTKLYQQKYDTINDHLIKLSNDLNCNFTERNERLTLLNTYKLLCSNGEHVTRRLFSEKDQSGIHLSKEGSIVLGKAFLTFISSLSRKRQRSDNKTPSSAGKSQKRVEITVVTKWIVYLIELCA